MKIFKITVFSTLALSACLPRAVVENEAVDAVGQGDAASVGAEVGAGVVGNGSAVADDANANGQNENQDGEDDAKENSNENENDNIGQILNGNLGNEFRDINIDPNDILGSLGQNILDLMLAMGICNFNLNSLQGLGLGNQIQLLLQLQQLQQLQALGIVNSFTVDQLIQQEILSRTFNLNIIKRSIDASVQQAYRGKKRVAMLKRQCANTGQAQGDANDLDGQEQADQDQVNEDQNNQGQEKEDVAEGENGDDVGEEKGNAEQDNEEGIEVP
ncbi:hypothetical protein SAMD00023353_0303760 [Rosellinia necatrix]|uniref:Uncharacterized protein n=1 Tax=Rosellinia necatrix TaxID=77044 RepID=A0A1W2TDZ5_ROSNE|nr:hypothetical protein SAMD00023353_0303760 [Rosellinia necatrix]